jgi:hypothetical protein
MTGCVWIAWASAIFTNAFPARADIRYRTQFVVSFGSRKND